MLTAFFIDFKGVLVRIGSFMSTNKIKQHFVPQSYLKRFSPNGESVFVYDKFKRVDYEANVRNIAQERYFYNLAEEFVTDEMKSQGYTRQIIEDTFTKIEDEFKRHLDNFLRRPRFTLQNHKTRFEIAQLIVIQILRTRESRDAIIETETKIRQKQFHDYLREKYPDIPEDQYREIQLTPEHESLLHAQYTFDVNELDRRGKELCKLIWMAVDNRTSKLLYTSDQPVIKQTMSSVLGSGDRKYYSLRMFYPIMPTKGILIFDREYYKALEQFDGQVYVLSEADIATYNKQQVIQSNRQVYSLDGDFTIAKETCDSMPEICSPSIEKVNVDFYYEKVSETKAEEIIVVQSVKTKKTKWKPPTSGGLGQSA
jgi:hypothetical protein